MRVERIAAAQAQGQLFEPEVPVQGGMFDG